jgi:hypothetical protein
MAGNLFSNGGFVLKNAPYLSPYVSDGTYMQAAIDSSWDTAPGIKTTFNKTGPTDLNALTNDTWTEMLLINAAAPQPIKYELIIVMLGSESASRELHMRVYIDDVLIGQGHVNRTAAGPASGPSASVQITHHEGAIICKKLKVDIKRVGTIAHSGTYSSGTATVFTPGVL